MGPHLLGKWHSWVLMWSNFYRQTFLIKGHLFLMAEFKANFKNPIDFSFITFCFVKDFMSVIAE